jgi:hypothetical protein
MDKSIGHLQSFRLSKPIPEPARQVNQAQPGLPLGYLTFSQVEGFVELGKIKLHAGLTSFHEILPPCLGHALLTIKTSQTVILSLGSEALKSFLQISSRVRHGTYLPTLLLKFLFWQFRR